MDNSIWLVIRQDAPSDFTAKVRILNHQVRWSEYSIVNTQTLSDAVEKWLRREGAGGGCSFGTPSVLPSPNLGFEIALTDIQKTRRRKKKRKEKT